MPKMFKMYGEWFIEVTPQPWFIKASKTVKMKLADGKRFCVNVNTGALTAYDPENVREEAVEKPGPKFKVTLQDQAPFALSSDFGIAKSQLENFGLVNGLRHCIVSSDQAVTPVGFPLAGTTTVFFDKVRYLYQASHAKAKA